MKYDEVTSSEVPIGLLLEADPSAASIQSYLPDSWCFVARQESEGIVGACVLKEIGEDTIELFNIAVDPQAQAKGIGSGLLRHVIGKLKSTALKRMELGTGSFGYQLTFYHRLGFRVGSVVKDHFVDNYPEAIYENGIQHKDMLRLYLDL